MALDDFAGDTTTSGVVLVGGSLTGTLEEAGDKDWVKVSLIQGQSYYFTLSGSTAGNGTLRDPYLYLYDSAGESLSHNDDSGGQIDSLVAYTASKSGFYYLAVGSYEDKQTGTYQLAANQYTDDNTPQNPAELTLGGSFAGTLEVKGDADWVTVSLTAGVTYYFSLEGLDTRQGTLEDPYLSLYDADGEYVGSADDGGVRRNSLLCYTPTESGTFFVGLSAYNQGSSGTYTLSLSERTDDYAGGIQSQASLGLGSSSTGQLEEAGDTDSFSLQLQAGHIYCFNLQGASSGQGTLGDGYLCLRDAQGNVLTWNDDGGTGKDARLVFSPAADGTFFIEASAFDGRSTGTYSLGASEVPGGAASSAGSSGRVTGVGLHEGDLAAGERDWVALALDAANVYLFALEGMGDDPLENASLRLYDANGTLVNGLGVGGGDSSATPFQPGQSGLYYVDIGANGQDDAGRYLLSVVERQLSEFSNGCLDGFGSVRDLFQTSDSTMPGTSAMVAVASSQEGGMGSSQVCGSSSAQLAAQA